ncbi:MAG: hypothetical protein JOY72_08505 [Actinobacteria bacterium]|nr:hypothetical protein [Actinomycetota bacterium]
MKRAGSFLLCALVVLVAAGCGSSQRAQLKKYVEQVNAVETQLQAPLAQVANTNRDFTTTSHLEKLAPKLAQDERTIHTLRVRLAALHPPAAARPVAVLLAKLVAEEESLAHQIRLTAVFLPAFRADLARVAPVSNAFRAAAHAAKTVPTEVAALDAYAQGLKAPLAALRALTPPPIIRPEYEAQLHALGGSRSTAIRLAAAVRAKKTTEAHALVEQLGRLGVSSQSISAQRAQIAAVRAYDAQVDRVNALGEQVQRELIKVESGLH